MVVESEEFHTPDIAAQGDQPDPPLVARGQATAEALPAELTGHRIGRFQVSHRLGSGGAATVYQAYDLIQGRTVALKVLLPGSDTVSRSRFRQEAQTASALHHPHIVRTLQVGDLAGTMAYIAMELVEGESLASLLDRCGALSPAESANLLEPIARALAYAHRSGIVHRDVKPSNILLQPASPGSPHTVQLESLDHPVVPLLSDFGIARAVDMPDLTHTGRTIGTPAYMAPEQCAGSRDADGRSDIYSLGAVLYRCLVGRAPFTGSPTQILYAHVYAPLTIPDDVLQTLTPVTVGILRRSLDKDPARRYGSATEMAAEMAAAAGRPAVAEPPAAVPTAAQERTATLTLGALPTVEPQFSAPRTATVLIPARRFGRPRSDAGRRPGPARSAAAEPVRSSLWARLERVHWGGLAAASSLLFVLVALAVLLSGRTVAWDRVAAFLRAPTRPVAIAAPRLQPSTAGPLATPAPPAADPTATAASAETPPLVAALPTTTVTTTSSPTAVQTLPLPTAGLPATEPTPTATDTPTLLPVTPPPAEPTATLPAATPTPSPPPVSPTPVPGQVSACSLTADPFFLEFLNRGDQGAELGCATNLPIATAVEVQPFQNGMMLRRDDSRQIYVRYGNQRWVALSDNWQEGEPSRSDDPRFAPPGPGLFQPERGFGRLWEQDDQLRGALGWATAPAAAFQGLAQSFAGGVLMGDLDSGLIYLFLRADLLL